MAARIIYLFTDTNLFIQCRPLDELGWSIWKDFDEVHLIVPRPVQREIDNQKNKGNDRVGGRARKTHSIFREIIIDKQGYKLICNSTPQVKLLIEPTLRPSSVLADRLDYDEPDDELVGCLHAYLAKNPDAEARLLTHDSGPMASAKMLELPFFPIPDSWLLSPENSDTEKKISRLENDLARFKKAEPEFKITCVDDEGNELSRLELEHLIYEAMTDAEVLEVLDSIKSRFPPATDFGLRETAERIPQMKNFPFAANSHRSDP